MLRRKGKSLNFTTPSLSFQQHNLNRNIERANRNALERKKTHAGEINAGATQRWKKTISTAEQLERNNVGLGSVI